MTSRTKRVVLAAALFAGGCDGDEEATSQDRMLLPKLTSLAEKAPEMDEPVDETIRLDNGFIPDPHVVEGSVLGTVDAETRAEGCSGWIATEPSHVFDAQGTFAELRVLAHSATDATLVVETPSGEHWCADDDEGTDPIVVRPFPRGSYRIWVGAPEADVEMPYVLGISELPDVSAASLAH